MTTKWTPSMLQPTSNGVLYHWVSCCFRQMILTNKLKKKNTILTYSHHLSAHHSTALPRCRSLSSDETWRQRQVLLLLWNLLTYLGHVHFLAHIGINMSHHIHHTCPSRSVFDRSKPCMYGGNSGLLNQTWTKISCDSL